MKEVFLLLKRKINLKDNLKYKIKKIKPNTFIIPDPEKIFCLLSGEIQICKIKKKIKNSKNKNLEFLKKKQNILQTQKIVNLKSPNFIEITNNFPFVIKTEKKQIEYIILDFSFFQNNLPKNNYLIFKKKLSVKFRFYDFYFKKTLKILKNKNNENNNFQKYKKKSQFTYNLNLKKKNKIWDVKKILKNKSCNLNKRIFLKPIKFPIKKVISEFETNIRIQRLNKVKKKNLKKTYTALKLIPPRICLIRQSLGRLKNFLE